MKRDDIDFHRVAALHQATHERLLNWARCVSQSSSTGSCQPMFRQYRSTEVWHTKIVGVAPDTIDGMRIEKEVAKLPEKHAHATRWCYVFPWRDERKVCRILAVTRDGLQGLITDSRSMLRNRLTQVR